MMRITDMQRFCMHDGPGVRTTVFFKGCPLRCAWCHNPETQSRNKELLVYAERCMACGGCAVCPQQAQGFAPSRAFVRERCVACGACASVCPTGALELVGRDVTASDLFAEIQKDRAFYGEQGGVTFSGGECMMQVEGLKEVLTLCKDNGISTAVDTSGYVPFAAFEEILPLTDLILYDIKCFDPETHKRFVGVDNALILDNAARLLDSGAPVWIRIPVVPTVNDSVQEMRRIKAFLDAHATPQKVELLPYHAMGDSKCRALGKTPNVFDVPREDTMQTLRAVFTCEIVAPA